MATEASSGADEFTFAWAPAESNSYLGGIVLRAKPVRYLSRLTYQHALMDRIWRLIDAEEPEVARELLGQVEREDTGVLFSSLRAAPPAIVEWSEWLNGRVHFPGGGVPASELEHDPDLLDLIVSDDCLEAYLNRLYDSY